MPAPKFDRPELRPDGFKGVAGGTVPAPVRPQAQPTSQVPPVGTPLRGGNVGSTPAAHQRPSYGNPEKDSFYGEQ